VLRVDAADRKIGLSRKQARGAGVEGGETTTEPRGSRPPGRELRGGTGAGPGALFSLPGSAEVKEDVREGVEDTP